MTSVKYKILSDNPNISIFAVNKHIKANLTYITNRSNIVFKSQINAGKFGFIFHADTPESEGVAIKVISEEDVGEYERVWKNLDNKFVLSLLKTHVYPGIKTRLFVMPRARNTLSIHIREDDFKNRSDWLDVLSNWIENVVSGAQYLHSNGYGHCSLKTKNVLIMEDNTAVLCHFHSLAPVNSFVKW